MLSPRQVKYKRVALLQLGFQTPEQETRRIHSNNKERGFYEGQHVVFHVEKNREKTPEENKSVSQQVLTCEHRDYGGRPPIRLTKRRYNITVYMSGSGRRA